jgi:hypothetical protein
MEPVQPINSTGLTVVPKIIRGLPQEIRSSLVVRKKKITKKALANYQNSMLVTHAPALIPAWFEQLYIQVQEGDSNAMQMVAKMYSYIQNGPSININNNLMQNNISQQGGRGFDNIVRKLAQEREARGPIDVTPEP